MSSTAQEGTSTRRSTGVRLLAGALLGVLIAAVFTLARAQPAEPIREAWRRPLGGVQCLAISPDGARTAVVTWASEVLCWDGNRLKWRRNVPGAEAVMLGAGGSAVVYTPLDALRRDLLILDGEGHVRARATVGGPITALALSPNGRNVAVGTADGTVELYWVLAPSRLSHLALPGPCQQLGFDGRGNLVVVTAAPAWLTVFDGGGHQVWRAAAPAGCEFRIATPPRAARLEPPGAVTVAAVVPALSAPAVTGKLSPPLRAAGPGAATRTTAESGKSRSSVPRPGRDQIQLVAYSVTGKPIWRHLLAGRGPSLRLMETNGEVVVAYERAEHRGAVQRFNRVLACFDRTGLARREQGGMVYNPLLVSAAPDGSWVLSLCSANRFWLLSGQGQTLWSYTSRAPVRMVRASADGTRVVVTTSDGQLSMLEINPAVGGGHHSSAEVADRTASDP